MSRACAVRKFLYTDFCGVEPEKYKGYVDFNTARHAFEAGFFQTEEPPPKAWVRKQRFTTSTAARSETRGEIQKRVPMTRVEMRRTGGGGTGAVKVGVYATLGGLFLPPPPFAFLSLITQKKNFGPFSNLGVR